MRHIGIAEHQKAGKQGIRDNSIKTVQYTTHYLTFHVICRLGLYTELLDALSLLFPPAFCCSAIHLCQFFLVRLWSPLLSQESSPQSSPESRAQVLYCPRHRVMVYQSTIILRFSFEATTYHSPCAFLTT